MITTTRPWYVVTGGPSSGKTTLLHELKKQGHVTIPEAARVVIDQSLAKGLTLAEIRADEKHFQDIVMKYKVDAEAHLDQTQLTFFDRGLHDTIAYLHANQLNIEDWVQQAVSGALYHKIFWLEPLMTYEQDYARNEDAGLISAELQPEYFMGNRAPLTSPLHPNLQYSAD